MHLNMIILMGICMKDKNMKKIKAESDVGCIFDI